MYRNLHNQHFWDWKHPFDKVQEQSNELKSKPIIAQADELSKNKGNLRILEEFRRYAQMLLQEAGGQPDATAFDREGGARNGPPVNSFPTEAVICKTVRMHCR